MALNEIPITEFFKALSDPTRLTIFRMLASNPERKLCVGAIAQQLDVTQPAVSQHLRVLKSVGLVTPNREGFRVHYTINPTTLEAFRTAVDVLYQSAVEPYDCQAKDEK